MLKKVLIADDEEDILLVLSAALDKQFDVLRANDGQQALDIALREKPALILLDINMPNMDGLEVLRQLKTAKATPAIIIMLTSIADTTTAEKALTMGASEYITKPFDGTKIRSIVESKLHVPRGDAPWTVIY